MKCGFHRISFKYLTFKRLWWLKHFMRLFNSFWLYFYLKLNQCINKLHSIFINWSEHLVHRLKTLCWLPKVTLNAFSEIFSWAHKRPIDFYYHLQYFENTIKEQHCLQVQNVNANIPAINKFWPVRTNMELLGNVIHLLK